MLQNAHNYLHLHLSFLLTLENAANFLFVDVVEDNLPDVAENHENIHATTAPDLSTSVVQTKPKNMDGSSNKNPIILSSENCKKLCDKIYNIIEKYYPICFSKNFKKEYKDRYVNFTC